MPDRIKDSSYFPSSSLIQALLIVGNSSSFPSLNPQTFYSSWKRKIRKEVEEQEVGRGRQREGVTRSSVNPQSSNISTELRSFPLDMCRGALKTLVEYSWSEKRLWLALFAKAQRTEARGGHPKSAAPSISTTTALCMDSSPWTPFWKISHALSYLVFDLGFHQRHIKTL